MHVHINVLCKEDSISPVVKTLEPNECIVK